MGEQTRHPLSLSNWGHEGGSETQALCSRERGSVQSATHGLRVGTGEALWGLPEELVKPRTQGPIPQGKDTGIFPEI